MGNPTLSSLLAVQERRSEQGRRRRNALSEAADADGLDFLPRGKNRGNQGNNSFGERHFVIG